MRCHHCEHATPKKSLVFAETMFDADASEIHLTSPEFQLTIKREELDALIAMLESLRESCTD